MTDTKNIVIAATLSLLVIFTWELFFGAKPTTQAIDDKIVAPTVDSKEINDISVAQNNISADKQEIEIVAEQINFDNSKISGEINLRGLRLNELTLKNYDQNKASSEKVKLLSTGDSPYFIELGYLANNVETPDKSSIWKKLSSGDLSPDNPLVVRWDARDGKFSIIREISLDDNYLFTFKDTLKNNSETALDLYKYGIINKTQNDFGANFFILHEGPVGVFSDELVEVKYKKMLKEQQRTIESYGGWNGISDKYWLTAFFPDTDLKLTYRFSGYSKNNNNKFQSDFQTEQFTLYPLKELTMFTEIFAGAKEVELIDQYAEKYDIALFDRSIDFGILYFLTKPIYLILKYLNGIFNNFGLAIIALTILIRILLFPLASKSFREISKMKKVQPEIIKIREAHKDDRMRINREVMKLYQKYSIRPMMGCLPVIAQGFVFFALYKVLFVTIDMRHAEFFGWINDLTAPDPTNLFNLFGLLPLELETPFGAWPCILAGTMIIQQRLNPTPADPMQAKMMKLLPYLFLFLFAGFPSGLVIYWTFNNAFSIAQQYYIMKKYS